LNKSAKVVLGRVLINVQIAAHFYSARYIVCPKKGAGGGAYGN
jgi:hypothetical protein